MKRIQTGLTHPLWPFSRVISAVFMLTIAITTYFMSRPEWDTYALWIQFNSNVHDSLLVVGPIVSFATALIGHSLARKETVFYQQAISSQWRQFATHIIRVSVGTLAAIVIGQLPALIWTLKTATWGTFDLGVLVMTVVWVFALAAIGMVAGSLINRGYFLAFVPTSILFVFLLTVNEYLPQFRALMPVWLWPSPVRFQHNPAVVVYIVVIGTLLVWLCGAVCVGRRDNFSKKAIGYISSVAIPIFILVAYAMTWKPDIHIYRDEAEAICVGKICVHPGNTRLIPKIDQVLGDVAAVTGEDFITLVYDVNVLEHISDEPLAVKPLLSPTLKQDPSRLIIETVHNVSGMPYCVPEIQGRGVDSDGSYLPIDEEADRLALQYYSSLLISARTLNDMGIVFDPGHIEYPELAVELDLLTAEELIELFAEEIARISTCQFYFSGWDS